jgi:Undecaprenyl-phosphate galactose phosphotransferase WbaP
MPEALLQFDAEAPLAAAAQPAVRARPWTPWLFVLADALSLELALALGFACRFALRGLIPFEMNPEQWSLAAGVLLLPAAFALAGLYPGYGLGAIERMRTRVYVAFVVFATLIAWDHMVHRGHWSRGALLATLLFALVLPPLVETFLRAALARRGWYGTPVLILGAGRTGRLIAQTLRKESGLGLSPLAFLDDNPRTWGRSLEGTPVVGSLALCRQFRGQARTAIVAMPGVSRERLVEVLHALPFPQVIVIPDLFGIQSLWIESRDLGGVLGLELKKNLLLRSNRLVKRALDYALGAPLALAAAPLVAFFALLIKWVSPGPAFYSQWREGLDGRPFRVLKLRTMRLDAGASLERYLHAHPGERENWERFFKLRCDPRVLPCIGAFLRRTSLDELPQLWNVLKGEMSLVGPRPFPSYHLRSFSGEFCALRASVLPGVTGLWQVSDRSDGDLRVQEALDTYYIRNWSVWMDLNILGRTVRAILAPRGAY